MAGLIIFFQQEASDRIIFIPKPGFENQLFSKFKGNTNDIVGLEIQSDGEVRCLVSDFHVRYAASLIPLWLSWKENTLQNLV